MTPKQVQRAAELLNEDAQAIRDTHTFCGGFVGEYADEQRVAYTERRALAEALRKMLRRGHKNGTQQETEGSVIQSESPGSSVDRAAPS